MADLKSLKSKKDSGAIEDRLPDATSKETLEDLEKSEKVSDSRSEHESDNSETLSPDGTNDKRREPDDAGPM
jgi:hypothetical protein